MSSKKRLYEVFSKVNELSFNEDTYSDNEQMDTFIDTITDEIKQDLSHNPKMFAKGVPQVIEITSVEYGNFKLVLDENNGIMLENTAESQLQYNALYNSSIQQYNFNVTVPFVVDVENQYAGGKIEFFTRTWHSPKEIDVQFER